LKTADFESNKITHLPESFGELKSLKTCWLNDNKIKSEELQRLRKQRQTCNIIN